VQSAVVVYDVTSIASFEIMKSWVSELKSLGPRDIRLVIAANKCDCDDRREVTSGTNAPQQQQHRIAPASLALLRTRGGLRSAEQLRTFAQESGAEPFEVSARTGKGVDKMFKEAAKGAKSVSEEHQVGMLSDLRKTAGEGAARLARRGSLDRGPK
jgi:GTPase SAR1 family protein